MNVIPGDDIMHACGHGGADSEDEALLKGPPQQAQNSVPLWAVGQVGNSVRARIPDSWVWVLLLQRKQVRRDIYPLHDVLVLLNCPGNVFCISQDVQELRLYLSH